MSHIDLNTDFRRALELLDGTNSNIFVTGRAGTGKSTLLGHFREHTKKTVAVIAPTGVAAVNVAGQTIHSFFGFRPDITIAKVRRDYRSIRKSGLYKKLDAIVIDEISMVRADLLDCIDTFLRMHGPVKNHPFGGIQMIFIGDLHQLPPVVTNQQKEMFSQLYESPYFFSAHVMDECSFEIIELHTIYRQDDNELIEILNAVRNNSIEDHHLDRLNSRFDESIQPDPEQYYIYITTTNVRVDAVNAQELHALAVPVQQFEAQISGNFDPKSAPAPTELHIALGAQVMLTNNDQAGRWINGTIGRIVRIDKKSDEEPDSVIVLLESGKEVEVTPHTWEMFQYYYDVANKMVDSRTVGSFTQYPITLAWAITIHKSQGKTFTHAIIDMDRGTFAPGQAYVALSRCVNLSGMILRRPIQPQHILTDARVSQFLTGYSSGRKSGAIELPF